MQTTDEMTPEAMAAFEDMLPKYAARWNAMPADVQDRFLADRKHGKHLAMMGALFMKHQTDGLLNEAAHWAVTQERMADQKKDYGGCLEGTEEDCD